MADSYVCSGATMKCSMGTSQAKLTVLPLRTVFLTGQPMANISDHLSMVNLSPFGRCRSLGFPATASATAANHGSLTPMPCMHNTPFHWMGGKNDYIVKGDPALLKSSTCQCMWGGTISITDDGQHGEGTRWVQKCSKVSFPSFSMEKATELAKKDINGLMEFLCDKEISKEQMYGLSKYTKDNCEELWSKLKKQRMKVAKDFYAKTGMDEVGRFSHLRCIDYNKPVKTAMIPPPKQLYQYQMGNNMGRYFTDDEKACPDDLGIYDKYTTSEGELLHREKVTLKISLPPIACLMSTAAPSIDNWSHKDKDGSSIAHETKGGGSQIYINVAQCVDKFQRSCG